MYCMLRLHDLLIIIGLSNKTLKTCMYPFMKPLFVSHENIVCLFLVYIAVPKACVHILYKSTDCETQEPQ